MQSGHYNRRQSRRQRISSNTTDSPRHTHGTRYRSTNWYTHPPQILSNSETLVAVQELLNSEMDQDSSSDASDDFPGYALHHSTYNGSEQNTSTSRHENRIFKLTEREANEEININTDAIDDEGEAEEGEAEEDAIDDEGEAEEGEAEEDAIDDEGEAEEGEAEEDAIDDEGEAEEDAIDDEGEAEEDAIDDEGEAEEDAAEEDAIDDEGEAEEDYFSVSQVCSRDADEVYFTLDPEISYSTDLRIAKVMEPAVSKELNVSKRCVEPVTLTGSMLAHNGFDESWFAMRECTRREYITVQGLYDPIHLRYQFDTSRMTPPQILRTIPALPNMTLGELLLIFPIEFMAQPISIERILVEDVFLDRRASSKTHKYGPRWNSVYALPYNAGKMYVQHIPGFYDVSLRAVGQGTAIWHHMILSTAACAISNRISHGDGLGFLLDAAIRISANCIFLGRNDNFGVGDPCWLEDHLAGLPREAVPDVLQVTQLVLPNRGPTVAIMRGFFGALAYWPELRIAISEPSTSLVRYATGHMELAEWFLFSRTHSLKPQFTPTEREMLASFFTLYVTLGGGMLNWICRATAMYLAAPYHSRSAYIAVCESLPYYYIPVNSDLLCDLEVLLLGEVDLPTVCESYATIAHELTGYEAVRTAATNFMIEFADCYKESETDLMVSAYLGAVLLLQRVLGHANLLLLLLSGAALYGGCSIYIPRGILDAYNTLMLAASPLYAHQTLTSFWKDRDDAMQTLGIRPTTDVLPKEQDRIVQASPIEMNFRFVGLETIYPREQPIPSVDLAENLMQYRNEILGLDWKSVAMHLLRKY
nr:tegument protein VP13/14 [Human alphaherpesvirus 3]